jgi:cystathionine gamma-synthase
MSSKTPRSASSTAAVHAGAPGHRPHHALSPAVAQTATYTFENTAALERYMRGEDPDPHREEYGRYGNPTVHELEARLAALEGAEDAVAFASGMAATTTVLLSLLKTGDHVVLFRDCYRRTRQFVSGTLPRFGIEHTLVPSGDLAAFRHALRPSTRLVISEAPTNPFLYCVDLAKLAQLSHEHGRVRVLVDSTLATPCNTRPLELGVDLVVHSATKYLSGHNDVLGGLVTGPSHLIGLLREARGVLGSVLDPHAAFLLIRGLRTLALRVERQNATALAVARALEGHSKIRRVFYPLLESHPSYPVARTQMHGGGGMVSFIVEGGREAASRVVDRCGIARIAPSFGGLETLIEQPAIMSFFELSEEELRQIEIDPALIRLSVGIEDTDDVVRSVLEAVSD